MMILPSLCYFLLFKGAWTLDFCLRDCLRGDQWFHHTGCNYDCKAKPGQVQMITEDMEKFRQIILDAHNILRNKIAMGNRSYQNYSMTVPPKATFVEDMNPKMPQPASLMALSYDEELEYTATCHASHGLMGHDKCRDTERLTPVGQNLYSRGRSGKLSPMKIDIADDGDSLFTAVAAWWAEVQVFDVTAVEHFHMGPAPSGTWGQWGHFTQMIWPETSRVGCAHSLNLELKHYLLTCNYWPAGNVAGRKMFEVGPVNCQKYYKLQPNDVYPGLCGPIEPIPKWDPQKKFNVDGDICMAGEVPWDGNNSLLGGAVTVNVAYVVLICPPLMFLLY